MPTTRRHFTTGDREAAAYHYVPFDVPPGTQGIEFTVRYDREQARLDVGLLDPDGFRGWSGSERGRIALTRAAATPGYVAGPLPAGTWQVVIGLYEMGADGIDVEVTFTVGPVNVEEPPAPAPLPDRPPPRDLPAAAGRRWLAGDLHSHTVHSDGALWPDKLACLARSLGLDFLAVTDHNTVSHHGVLPAVAARTGVVLLPGQEVTTDEGHATVLGDVPWIDFREPADQWLAAAEAAGGLMCLAHPVAGPWSWRHPMRRPAPLVEGWHGSWDGRWPDPWEWSVEHGGVLVGGSDFHRFDDWARLGVPTTYAEIDGAPSVAAVLAALRDGRVAISASPTAPVLLPAGGGLLAIDAAGTTLGARDGSTRAVVESRQELDRAGPGPYRLLDADGRCVATAP